MWIMIFKVLNQQKESPFLKTIILYFIEMLAFYYQTPSYSQSYAIFTRSFIILHHNASEIVI